MPRNNHREIENSQIHPPKDFSTADNGDRIEKNLNGELIWIGSPWQPNTIDVVDINDAPPTEENGDRYIVIEITSTVADPGWDGAAVNDIVEFSDTNNTWGNRAPAKGDITYNETLDDYYQYDGDEWIVLIAGGGGGSITINWKFSTNITDANPGSGNFRLNNATQGSATSIFVSDFSDNGTDVTAILDSVKIGTDIYIQQGDDSTRFHLATVNAVPIDATTYWKIPITISDSGADIQNNKSCPFVFLGGGADFSDGGEAGGKNRTLGNTDNFGFALLTNNNQRISILNDGKVGINETTPLAPLHVKSSGVANVFIISPNTGSSETKVEENVSNEMNLIMKNAAGTEVIKLSTSSGINSFVNAGNFGIGASGASVPLHVSKSNTSTTPAVRIENTLTGDAGLEVKVPGQSYYFAIDQNDLKKLKIGGGSVIGVTPFITIDITGCIGLGITTPEGILHTEQSTDAKGVFFDNIGNTANAPFLNLRKSRAGAVINSGDGIGRIKFMGHDGTDLNTTGVFIQAESEGTIAGNKIPASFQIFTMNLAGTLAERMRITPDGDLGIGVTSPDEKLHVNGNVKVDGNIIANNFPQPTLTVENPGASENITFFRTDFAITVQEVITVLRGSSTPSVTYQLKHATTRNAAGNNLTNSGAVTSITTGDTATLNDATIPANSWVWLITTVQSGTVDEMSVNLRYKPD